MIHTYIYYLFYVIVLIFLPTFYSCVQDPDPGVQHGDGAGGVAAGLHAARLPLPRGVRRHPQADRPLQEVGTL